MRGRYMAVFGLGWAIPNSVAPFMAGLVMDNYDPYWVWYFAGVLAVIAVICFGLLQYKVGDKVAAYMLTDKNDQ